MNCLIPTLSLHNCFLHGVRRRVATLLALYVFGLLLVSLDVFDLSTFIYFGLIYIGCYFLDFPLINTVNKNSWPLWGSTYQGEIETYPCKSPG